MKSLLINIVAVTFLGASGSALATSSGGEAPPLGMQKQLERSYSVARSDRDNFVLAQHRYDDHRHKPHQKYRHGKPNHPKYSHGKYGHGKYEHGKYEHGKYKHGKYKQKDYGHRKYRHGQHWDNRNNYRGQQKHGHRYRHGYSRDHSYNKHRDDVSIRLKFGSDGLVHYRTR